MGWKDTVWEQRRAERIKNASDYGKVFGTIGKVWDLGSDLAGKMNISNPMDYSGDIEKFKKSLF